MGIIRYNHEINTWCYQRREAHTGSASAGLTLSPPSLGLGDGETGRPSDEGFDASDQWFRISKVREPVSPSRSSLFDSPTRVPEVTQTPGRVRVDNSPCGVDGAVSGNTVGSQPVELCGWVRIGPDSSPDVVLEHVNGHERLLQPQVILRPERLSTSSQALKATTHPGVGSNELRESGVPDLVGSSRGNQHVTKLLARRGVVHHDTSLQGVSYKQNLNWESAYLE